MDWKQVERAVAGRVVAGEEVGAVRGILDPANLLLVGYPLLVLAGLWFWPDITGVIYCLGAAIAIPIFLLQGRGDPVEPDSPKQRFPWFRLFLAGVAFSWPFILAYVIGWWERRRTRQKPER